MNFPSLDYLLQFVPSSVADHAEFEFSYDFQYFADRANRLQLSGDKILDAGCGMGQWSAVFSTRFREVYAFDYADYMVNATKELLKYMSIKNVNVIQADISGSLPYENNSFDAIFCYSVLSLVNSPDILPRVLREFNRILKPGGKVYICINDVGWYLYNTTMPMYAASGRGYLANTFWKRFLEDNNKEKLYAQVREFLGDTVTSHLDNDFHVYLSGQPISLANEYRRAYCFSEMKSFVEQAGFENFITAAESCLVCDGADTDLQIKPKYIGCFNGHVAVWECMFKKPEIDSVQKVVIFGCGILGSRAYFSIKERCDVTAFASNDAPLWGQTRAGIKIIPPNEIPSAVGKDGIVIVCEDEEKIIRQLEERGLSSVILYDHARNIFVNNKKGEPASADWNSIKWELLPVSSSADSDSIVRKFPFPYNAMLAITSDCDYASKETFEDMHKFLNTFEESVYGKGVGLDISDSFFIFNGGMKNASENQTQLSWVHGLDPDNIKDAELIIKYWNAGWIDSMHTFGDFSDSSGETVKPYFTRNFAIQGWKILNESGIRPTVWIDHGACENIQNFSVGCNLARRYSDNPSSVAYHTGITLHNSVRFAWCACWGVGATYMFGHEFPLFPYIIGDGQMVWMFWRNVLKANEREAVPLWHPHMLRHQITADKLDELEREGHYAILAQHLDMQDKKPESEDIEAIRLLAERFHERRSVLVARTSRLLAYAVAQRYLEYQILELDNMTIIRIVAVNEPVTGRRIPDFSELKGMTFYVNNPDNTIVLFRDKQIAPEKLQRNNKDSTGKKSISIPWHEQDTFDYTSG